MKVIMNTIYLLGILMLIGSLLIFFKVFSKDTFENLGLILMILYAYLALTIPLFSESKKILKKISLLAMIIFPIGLLYPKLGFLSLLVLFFCVYLCMDHGFFGESDDDLVED
jgi:hypothetical protein